MAHVAKRKANRCPTHPGALLREDVIPATGRTKAEIAQLLLGVNVVPERLEQAAQQPLAAAAGKNGEPGDQRQGPFDHVWLVLTPTREGRSEDSRDRDAHERGCDVGSVVDVRIERSLAVTPAAHEPDRIDIEQERGGAPFDRRFRIEDLRLAERQLDLLHPRRVLMQKESQVGRRLGGCGNGQEHDVPSAFLER